MENKIQKVQVVGAAPEVKDFDNLRKHLEANPGIKQVYFNEKKEWFFHERAEFPIVVPREEILEEDFELNEELIDDVRNERISSTPNAATATDAMQNNEASKALANTTKKLTKKEKEQLAEQAVQTVTAINQAPDLETLEGLVGDDEQREEVLNAYINRKQELEILNKR